MQIQIHIVLKIKIQIQIGYKVVTSSSCCSMLALGEDLTEELCVSLISCIDLLLTLIDVFAYRAIDSFMCM